MNDPAVRKREVAPLQMIRDGYEKMAIAENCDICISQDGIRIERLAEFLLED